MIPTQYYSDFNMKRWENSFGIKERERDTSSLKSKRCPSVMISCFSSLCLYGIASTKCKIHTVSTPVYAGNNDLKSLTTI